VPQSVTTENSMGVVQMSRGRLAPASPWLLSEPQIVARVALATLEERTRLPWSWLADDYDRIRDLIAQVVEGAGEYNRRVRQPGGFYLPNPVREGRFATASGRARFTVHRLPRRVLEPGQLLMMTVRSHDQYNTTIYGLEDRYRGLAVARRVVLMHPQDLRERGLEPHQAVDLTSHFRGETRVARQFVAVPYDIPRGCACTYFPEANVLVPIDQVAHTSNTPSSKSVVISVSPANTNASSGAAASNRGRPLSSPSNPGARRDGAVTAIAGRPRQRRVRVLMWLIALIAFGVALYRLTG